MQTRSSGGAPILAFLSIVALWACGIESVQGPETSQFVRAGGPAQILLPPCNANSLPGFTIRWTCGNLVILVNGPTAFQDAIEASLTRWNDALDLAAVIHRPRLGWISNPAFADVIVNVTTSSSDYCGNESGTTGNSTINMFPGTCGDFGTALTHELAHTLGFTTHKFDGQAGVSEQCVFSIQADSVVHGSICQHEIEYIYQAYGQRQGGFTSTAFWDHPIVTGLLTTPFSISVDQGASVSVNVDKLFFANGQTQPADPVGTTFIWNVEPNNIASVSPSGVVTGLIADSGDVLIRSTCHRCIFGARVYSSTSTGFP